jgi:hypothetical protein
MAKVTVALDDPIGRARHFHQADAFGRDFFPSVFPCHGRPPCVIPGNITILSTKLGRGREVDYGMNPSSSAHPGAFRWTTLMPMRHQ